MKLIRFELSLSRYIDAYRRFIPYLSRSGQKPAQNGFTQFKLNTTTNLEAGSRKLNIVYNVVYFIWIYLNNINVNYEDKLLAVYLSFIFCLKCKIELF